MLPWDLNPDLARERLMEIGQILRNARNGALERHDEDAGDDEWSLGCRAYAWCKNRIRDAADEGVYPWLSILDRSLEFVFQIGATPMRIFRSDGDEAAAKFLRRAKAEIRQAELVFPGENLSTRLHWRFVTETDVDGAVDRIVLLGLTASGETRCMWEVPPADGHDGGIPKPEDIGPHEGAVEVPEPEVRLKRSAGKTA